MHRHTGKGEQQFAIKIHAEVLWPDLK